MIITGRLLACPLPWLQGSTSRVADQIGLRGFGRPLNRIATAEGVSSRKLTGSGQSSKGEKQDTGERAGSPGTSPIRRLKLDPASVKV